MDKQSDEGTYKRQTKKTQEKYVTETRSRTRRDNPKMST